MSVSHSISVGFGAEALDGRAVERPDRRCDPRPVRVDQARAAGIESGEMDLGHALGRDRREIGLRVEAVIDRVDIDVVDVEQQLAAAFARDGGDEVPLGHRIVGEAQIGRDVLHQQRTAERELHRVDTIAYQRQRLFGQRQRQQIVQMAAVDMAPAQMLGDRRRFDAVEASRFRRARCSTSRGSAEPSDRPTPCSDTG